MSIYGNQQSWAETYRECGGANQSPINLSRTFAKPCQGLCDLEVKDSEIDTVIAMANTPYNAFQFIYNSGPSIVFEGNGYQAFSSYLTNPGLHAIEGVKSKAEFFTIFMSAASEERLIVSVPLHVSSEPTASSQFLNNIVSYVNELDKEITVKLPEPVKFAQIIPVSNPSYFVYEGSLPFPGCQKVKWVVFENSVNIDPNTLSQVVGKVQSGSRDLQDLRDREVFINDVDALKGAEVENSGKVYLKCRRLGPGGDTSPIVSTGEKPDLKEMKKEKNNDKMRENIQWFFTEPVIWNTFSYAFFIALILFGFCPFMYFLFFTQYPIEIATMILNTIVTITYYLIRRPIEYLMAPPSPN